VLRWAKSAFCLGLFSGEIGDLEEILRLINTGVYGLFRRSKTANSQSFFVYQVDF
jgi:hypothetical protein